MSRLGEVADIVRGHSGVFRLRRSPPWQALVLCALAQSPVIEAVQLMAVPLDRACQSGDASDNVVGLLVGLALGGRIGWLACQPRTRF